MCQNEIYERRLPTPESICEKFKAINVSMRLSEEIIEGTKF